MPADEIHLKRLKNNCSVTLDRYMDVARMTCEMVGALRKLPVPKDRQLAIHVQRRREDEARGDYQKASRELLNALEIRPDLADSEPAPQPLRGGKPRGARLITQRRDSQHKS
jgi:hypothetical protein